MSATLSVGAHARSVPASAVGVAAVLIVAFGVLPIVGNEYLFDAILTPFLALSLAQFFVPWALNKFGWFSNDDPSGVISAPALWLGPVHFDGPRGRYMFCLIVVTVATLLAWRLVRSRTGRNFVAIRDHEMAARVIGVPVLRTKLVAFAASSFIIGIAGVLWAFAYLRTVEPAGFNLDRSFQILFIVILGGLASLRGAFLGAALMVTFPLILARVGQAVLGGAFDSGVLEMSQRIAIGAMIVLFLIAEPAGLADLLDRAYRRVRA
jgi:branched-chain amino acid transport system permease protein